jgi:hypothetical protein
MKTTFGTIALTVVLGAAAGYGGSFANAGHNGKQGSSGKIGIAGKAGPTGKPGQSAVNADLGVCVNITLDPTDSWVTSDFSIETPIIFHGVRSCYVGSFVSVVPAP